jgi:ribosomal protein S18 acetylase RimI-like enzyme
VRTAYAHYVERMGKEPGPMLDDYAHVITTHGATVAERDGTIIGVVVLQRRPDGPLLDNVAVHPDAQGLGVGRALIEHAEASARADGAEHIDLYTHEAMVENIAMYSHLGYAQTHRAVEKGYARVYMRKQLSGGHAS